MDEYEKDWIGLNLLDFNEYVWFKHDCQNRLNDLLNLIYGEGDEYFYKELPQGISITDNMLVNSMVTIIIATMVNAMLEESKNPVKR